MAVSITKEKVGTKSPSATTKEKVGTKSPTIKKEKVEVKKEPTAATDAPTIYKCSQCSFTANTPSKLAVHRHRHTKKRFSCAVCDKSFKWRVNLTLHMKLHTGEGLIPCPVCNRPCFNPSDLARHMDAHNDSAIYSCAECGKAFRHKQNYNQHMKLHTGEGLHKCKLCKKVFTSTRFLNLHMQSHSRKKKFKCMDCGKLYKTKQSLKYHSRLHTGYKVHVCDHCGKIFPVKSVLEQHMQTHSLEPQFECKDCGKKYKHLRALERHQQVVHIGRLVYTCKECGKKFPSQSTLGYHMDTHATTDQYECPICKEKFRRKRALRYHEKLHTGKGLLKCTECGKTFFTPSGLKTHMDSHSSDLNYECQKCGRMYKHERALQRHIECHTLGTKHECEVCGKVYKDRVAYLQHMRLHTGKGLVTCEVCGKQFPKFCQLERHRDTHATEANYECQVCHKKYRHKHDLVTHSRIHTDRRIECSECGKVFATKQQLQWHVIHHSGEPVYKCEKCNAGFKYNSSLVKHRESGACDRQMRKIEDPSKRGLIKIINQLKEKAWETNDKPMMMDTQRLMRIARQKGPPSLSLKNEVLRKAKGLELPTDCRYNGLKQKLETSDRVCEIPAVKKQKMQNERGESYGTIMKKKRKKITESDSTAVKKKKKKKTTVNSSEPDSKAEETQKTITENGSVEPDSVSGRKKKRVTADKGSKPDSAGGKKNITGKDKIPPSAKKKTKKSKKKTVKGQSNGDPFGFSENDPNIEQDDRFDLSNKSDATDQADPFGFSFYDNLDFCRSPEHTGGPYGFMQYTLKNKNPSNITEKPKRKKKNNVAQESSSTNEQENVTEKTSAEDEQDKLTKKPSPANEQEKNPISESIRQEKEDALVKMENGHDKSDVDNEPATESSVGSPKLDGEALVVLEKIDMVGDTLNVNSVKPPTNVHHKRSGPASWKTLKRHHFLRRHHKLTSKKKASIPKVHKKERASRQLVTTTNLKVENSGNIQVDLSIPAPCKMSFSMPTGIGDFEPTPSTSTGVTHDSHAVDQRRRSFLKNTISVLLASKNKQRKSKSKRQQDALNSIEHSLRIVEKDLPQLEQEYTTGQLNKGEETAGPVVSQTEVCDFREPDKNVENTEFLSNNNESKVSFKKLPSRKSRRTVAQRRSKDKNESKTGDPLVEKTTADVMTDVLKTYIRDFTRYRQSSILNTGLQQGDTGSEASSELKLVVHKLKEICRSVPSLNPGRKTGGLSESEQVEALLQCVQEQSNMPMIKRKRSTPSVKAREEATKLKEPSPPGGVKKNTRKPKTCDVSPPTDAKTATKPKKPLNKNGNKVSRVKRKRSVSPGERKTTLKRMTMNDARADKLQPGEGAGMVQPKKAAVKPKLPTLQQVIKKVCAKRKRLIASRGSRKTSVRQEQPQKRSYNQGKLDAPTSTQMITSEKQEHIIPAKSRKTDSLQCQFVSPEFESTPDVPTDDISITVQVEQSYTTNTDDMNKNSAHNTVHTSATPVTRSVVKKKLAKHMAKKSTTQIALFRGKFVKSPKDLAQETSKEAATQEKMHLRRHQPPRKSISQLDVSSTKNQKKEHRSKQAEDFVATEELNTSQLHKKKIKQKDKGDKSQDEQKRENEHNESSSRRLKNRSFGYGNPASEMASLCKDINIKGEAADVNHFVENDPETMDVSPASVSSQPVESEKHKDDRRGRKPGIGAESGKSQIMPTSKHPKDVTVADSNRIHIDGIVVQELAGPSQVSCDIAEGTEELGSSCAESLSTSNKSTGQDKNNETYSVTSNERECRDFGCQTDFEQILGQVSETKIKTEKPDEPELLLLVVGDSDPATSNSLPASTINTPSDCTINKHDSTDPLQLNNNLRHSLPNVGSSGEEIVEENPMMSPRSCQTTDSFIMGDTYRNHTPIIVEESGTTVSREDGGTEVVVIDTPATPEEFILEPVVEKTMGNSSAADLQSSNPVRTEHNHGPSDVLKNQQGHFQLQAESKVEKEHTLTGSRDDVEQIVITENSDEQENEQTSVLRECSDSRASPKTTVLMVPKIKSKRENADRAKPRHQKELRINPFPKGMKLTDDQIAFLSDFTDIEETLEESNERDSDGSPVPGPSLPRTGSSPTELTASPSARIEGQNGGRHKYGGVMGASIEYVKEIIETVMSESTRAMNQDNRSSSTSITLNLPTILTLEKPGTSIGRQAEESQGPVTRNNYSSNVRSTVRQSADQVLANSDGPVCQVTITPSNMMNTSTHATPSCSGHGYNKESTNNQRPTRQGAKSGVGPMERIQVPHDGARRPNSPNESTGVPTKNDYNVRRGTRSKSADSANTADPPVAHSSSWLTSPPSRRRNSGNPATSASAVHHQDNSGTLNMVEHSRVTSVQSIDFNVQIAHRYTPPGGQAQRDPTPEPTEEPLDLSFRRGSNTS